MRLDSNPLFRKAATPWYDGNFACWGGMGLMLAIVLFAAVGISVASGHEAFQPYRLVPWLLLVPSVLVILSIAWRLAQRYVIKRAMHKE
ncbi:MAG: hypothetical protein P8X55_13120 [Desulfosarcinaceae bacterium]